MNIELEENANPHSESASKASAVAYRASDATAVENATEKSHRTAEKAHTNAATAHENASIRLQNPLPTTSKMHARTAKHHESLAAAHKEAADNIAELKKRANESIDMDESVLVGTWHSGDYHKSKEDKDNGDGTHSRVMNHSDISDDNGYSAEDHKAVSRLKLGQTHHIDPSHSISKVGHKLTESNMNENTQNLISAIASGDTIASSAALSTALFGKIAEKMNARRKEIAKSMFKESVEDLDEDADITDHKFKNLQDTREKIYKADSMIKHANNPAHPLYKETGTLSKLKAHRDVHAKNLKDNASVKESEEYDKTYPKGKN